ncbi:TrbG/VirB9 family P-type conjugative transfer protein [Muricoccus vinaceus]|uniref:TrbG/VirB9 family P-type conjugative transfer protein n=1 Tax=Muricoccus vinaceus TaxID=424704 RepID=A0ABV6J0S5_9PROT
MRALLLAATAAAISLPAVAQQVPPIGSMPPGMPPGVPPGMPPGMAGAGPGGLSTASAGGAVAPTGATAAAPVPANMPPTLPTMSPSAPLSRRDASALNLATRWRLRSCGTSMGADGVLQVVHGACEPTLVCAPLKVCDVALEPGESPIDTPVIGDPRWQAVVRNGMDGGRRTMHIAFKPADAGLDSNFVLTTSQRTISLRLVSTQRNYMPFLKLGNPAYAQAQQWRQFQAQAYAAGMTGGAGGRSACDGQPIIPSSAFDIDVPRAARDWAPLQAYVVAGPAGTKTCIEFPASGGGVEPTLVVLGSDGGQQLTTARVIGRRMEVDAVLTRADLVVGVGSNQVAVGIRRKGA